MNKYLEKIAAKVRGMKYLHRGVDMYHIHEGVKEKRKKKPTASAKASRRWNKGPVRKD